MIISAQIKKIDKLNINATNYNAFKLAVNFSDREKLLNADMWPCGIIVNKFYNRRRQIVILFSIFFNLSKLIS